jgi:hypothetical protein
MKEMDSMWHGMFDRRKELQSNNRHGIHAAEIASIDAMFLEMYASKNWGRKQPTNV